MLPGKFLSVARLTPPGPVQIQEGMTPMQAIFDRGGFKDTAQRDGVVLIRDGGSENPQIEPHRSVHVSHRMGHLKLLPF